MKNMETKTDQLEEWLHLHIRRMAVYCDETLRRKGSIHHHLAPYPHYHGLDWAVFRCEQCGYEGVHPTVFTGVQEIHAIPHKAPLPPYLSDGIEMLKLLRTLRGRDQESGLLHHWLLLSGFSKEELPISVEDLEVAISWEVAKLHLRKSGELLEQAWRNARLAEEKWNKTQGALAWLEWDFLAQLKDMRQRPLFARMGPARLSYHLLDTPYLVAPESGLPFHRGRVVLRMENVDEFAQSFSLCFRSSRWTLGPPGRFLDGQGMLYAVAQISNHPK